MRELFYGKTDVKLISICLFLFVLTTFIFLSDSAFSQENSPAVSSADSSMVSAGESQSVSEGDTSGNKTEETSEVADPRWGNRPEAFEDGQGVSGAAAFA